MNKNQYVNSILKRLLATDRTKKRIRADLMTEIEALEDQGFSLEEIVRQKGEPELVAKEFNDSSSDPEAQRQYYLQRGLKIAVIVPGALMKAAKFTGRLAPEKLMLRCSYHMQNRKGEDESPINGTEAKAEG